MTQVSPHGLHHVTAIATDHVQRVDFYTRAPRAAPGQADGQSSMRQTPITCTTGMRKAARRVC
jgi:hypothetical protein